MNNALSTTEGRIEILTVGDELLDGVIADTNAAWLGQTLSDKGYKAQQCTTVRDEFKAIRNAFEEITRRADLCICTGGLGPTEDDITVDALAQAMGVHLEHHTEVWWDICQRYAPRVPPENNRRQARVPEGAVALRSTVGTAPGIHATLNGCQVYVFPGVPREFKWFVETFVLSEAVADRGPYGVSTTLRFSGIGESDLALKLRQAEVSEDISIGYRTALPENHIRLRAPTEESLERAARAIVACAPSHFVGRDDNGLAEHVLQCLRTRGLTLATAESCTGGLIGSTLTSVPGASDVYQGSVISYSESVKHTVLEVRSDILNTSGVYSEACVREMAKGAQRLLKTDWVIAVSGLAGPGGERPDTPVGTVYFAWAGPEDLVTKTRHFRGDRTRIRRLATGFALDGIRKYYGD